MRRLSLLAFLLPLLLLHDARGDAGWQVPVVMRKLPNGLTVIVSEDHSAPTFGLCLMYRIGIRLEPRGRSGFAHLFEHLMFQGTPKTPKGVMDRVIEGGGGQLNGSTRDDFTEYVASAPVSALDAMLWLEADRMKTLDFSQRNLQNQKDVVKEEIRVSVQNRPYGLFFWTDLHGKAFDRWENTHDGYGSFADLDAARLADAETFYRSYYGPNNAVLAISGDVTPTEVMQKVQKYFAAIPARATPPPRDLSEPLGRAERTLTQTDTLAQVPALAIGWRSPGPGSPDQAPAAVLASLLCCSDASRLYLSLVKGREMVVSLDGGLNWPLGDPWDYGGPTLMTVFAVYKPGVKARDVVAAVAEQVKGLIQGGVPAAELRRVQVKMRASFYSSLELPQERASALAAAQLISGDAASLNRIPARIDAVTAADLQRVAATYLTAANRTVIDRVVKR